MSDGKQTILDIIFFEVAICRNKINEKRLAKAIEQYIKVNYTKNTVKKYSDCCNYEIYEKPNSWKEYCSNCNQSCGTVDLKKGLK